MQYTDSASGITFDTWPVPQTSTVGGMTFGVALPSNALTVDATEFIGYLVSYPPLPRPSPILLNRPFSNAPPRMRPTPAGVVFRWEAQ